MASEFVHDTRHDRYPVAVHVLVTDHAGRVLLMRRDGTDYGRGLLGFPAGHVDLGETVTQCAVRELGEELGITLDPAELIPAGVMFRRSLEPRVDFFFTAARWHGTPRICEPQKCTELVWIEPDKVPEDALDYVWAALAGARSGHVFREYGWDTVPATSC